MLEQAIADFYESMLEHGEVLVYVIGDEYYINNSGAGLAFDKEEIEWAAMSTSMDVRYIRLG